MSLYLGLIWYLCVTFHKKGNLVEGNRRIFKGNIPDMDIFAPRSKIFPLKVAPSLMGNGEFMATKNIFLCKMATFFMCIFSP